MSAARERLMGAAGQLFAERGYECVGINEIIATAGIAKATFYQHFSSKEALCEAWLEGCAELSKVEYERLLNDPRAVRSRLKERFRTLRDWLVEENFPGCPFCVTTAMTQPDSGLRRPVVAYRELARSFWRELAAQHEPKEKKAKALGDAWFLLYTGAATEAQNVRDVWPVKRAYRAALELAGWS